MKGPDPNSNRSKQRANRGFVSLEQSCRKHRRALQRSAISRTVGGKLLQAGDKAEVPPKMWLHTAGGSLKYH